MLPIYALQSGSSAPLPDPAVLSSLSYDQGQPEGGGASIVLQGSGFTGATDVDFGGSSASFTIDSDTQITATLPAHAAGVVDVTVVNAGGSSNALSFEFWSPASLSLTFWGRDYDGTPPLPGTASAGVSGSQDATTDGDDPSASADLNGYGTIADDGYLVLDDNQDDYLDSSGFSGWVFFKPNTASAHVPLPDPYDNAGLLGDKSGAMGVTFTKRGFGVYCIAGGYVEAIAPAGVGEWMLGRFRHDGTDLEVGVNGDPMTTVSAPTPDVEDSGRVMQIGRAYLTSIDGDIAEAGLTKSVLNDATFTKLLKYGKQRFAEDLITAPAITGISPALGDVGGGISVTITGVGFTGETTATIGGTSCTSVVVVDDNTITCVTPAKSAGSYDVQVGSIPALASAFESWSPASESLTVLLLPGSYAKPGSTGTWTRTASAGTSGNSGRDVSEGTNPPTDSSGIPDFDGTNDQLVNGTLAFSTIASAGAGTMLAIFRADTLAAAGTNTVDNTGIISDGAGGYVAMTVSASGFGGYIYSSGHKQPTKTAMSTGTWYLGVVRWDGSHVSHALNDAWETPVSAGNVGSLTGTIRVGRNYLSKYFDGRMRMVAIAASALSDAVCSKFYVWATGKGYLA